MEFSTNIMDLNLDIGMMIQKLQNGEEDDLEVIIENLEGIQQALHKIGSTLMGGERN